MSSVLFQENFAVLEHSQSVVKFTNAESEMASASTVLKVRQMQNTLGIAPWGEDNRFPQNIVRDISTCGVAQSTLNWKSKSLWGAGLVYGSVVDIDKSGNEVFKVAKKGDFEMVDKFFLNNNIPRFYTEFNQDWVYFGNCFPELIFHKTKKEIAGIVHQESADCRYEQMNDKGKIETVYLSKLWGATKEQMAIFDPNKTFQGVGADEKLVDINSPFISKLPCADMYFPMESVNKIHDSGKKSFILPVNYPSPNKTYYQVAPWDGVRRSGWIEIAAKIPELIKTYYGKAFSIRYHIEIPEKYFAQRFGEAEWKSMDIDKRKAAREAILQSMDKFLSGSENAYKSFISYFEIDHVTHSEYSRIKITPIKNESTIDKDLLTSGTANSEIMFAMGVNPNILGAGKPGGVYSSNQGGSNIREGKLEHDSSISLERQLILEPLNFIKKFNKWPEDVEFRFKDTVLLTLDQGAQAEQKIN